MNNAIFSEDKEWRCMGPNLMQDYNFLERQCDAGKQN